MAERRKLGKGLSTLIPTERAESAAPTAAPTAGGATGQTQELPASALRDVPTGSIEPNPNQPRVHFDEDSLSDLA